MKTKYFVGWQELPGMKYYGRDRGSTIMGPMAQCWSIGGYEIYGLKATRPASQGGPCGLIS